MLQEQPMPRLVHVRPRRPDLKIPMPDRGFRLAGESETVDREDPHYKRLIDEGDLVIVNAVARDRRPKRSDNR
jgi:hypothetical protein